MLLLEELLDAPNDAAVVDGGADLAALGRVLAAQADFQIELNGLGYCFLPIVYADQRFYFEFGYEDDVHIDTGKEYAFRKSRSEKLGDGIFWLESPLILGEFTRWP